MRKFGIVGLLLIAALMVPLAGHAQPFLLNGTSDGTGGNGGTGNPHVLNARGTAVGTLYASALGGISVTFACEATATGVVSQTAIQECYLQSITGQKWYAQARSLPGNASTAVRSSIVPLNRLRVCWVARATFVVGAEDVSTGGCTPFS